MDLENIETTNFIEEEIVKDLKNGRVDYVQMRFPPEPTGFWHIGHVKAIMVAFETAKKFGGKTLLRLDDTNPLKEDMKYVESYLEDLKWLGYTPANVVFASEEYNEKIYQFAEDVIKKGLAYVCDLNAEEVSKTRGTLTEPGQNSPYRNRSIEENLQLFRDMRAGKYPDGSKCLRAKIDMASPNINMRDPVIYRILRATHYRVGNKWCIWPAYDFAHPLQDYLEGVTFSTCDVGFEDHRPLYNWALDSVGAPIKNRPRQIEFAKLIMENTIMGKRHLKTLVEKGVVMGWDDPRLLTNAGMRRRGYTAEGVKDFVRKSGVGKSDSVCRLKALEASVREELNTKAERVMVVLDPLKVVITNSHGNEECFMENLPGSEEKHKFTFGKELYIEKADFSENPPPKYNRLVLGGMVRLKGAYIIKCNNVVKNNNGEIDHLECEIVEGTKSGSDNSGIKVKGTIHFAPANENIKITIREFDNLVKPQYENVYKELNAGVDLFEMINVDSMHETTALAENFIKTVEVGKAMQFMRNGYYTLDKDSTDDNLIFNKTVALKESF